MEGAEGSAASRHTLRASRVSSEDILFCIDVDPQSLVEMKVSGPHGRPFTRLDSIKQALVLFLHAKLAINADHKFAFATLSKSPSWLRKEFSGDIESASEALRGLSATSSSSSSQADLTNLFRVASHEAKKSRSANRIFRVVLIYCRSSTSPQHQWPVNQKLFTFDVIYLHDKPGPENCPQEVYDSLVDAMDHVSEYEGYILESGAGLQRTLFRHMCVLLSHPQQRVAQDFLDVPKSLVKKQPLSEAAADDSAPMSSQ